MIAIDSLQKVVIELQIQNASLAQKIENVNTLYQNRFSDWYIFFGFFITLLIGAFVSVWYNAKREAKEQAEKEMELFKQNFVTLENETREKFNILESEAILKLESINSIFNQINNGTQS